MEQELYYLLPKKVMDGLIAIYYSYQQKQIIDAVIDKSKLIDLSDEAIEAKSNKDCSVLSFDGRYSYKEALTDLKTK